VKLLYELSDLLFLPKKLIVLIVFFYFFMFYNLACYLIRVTRDDVTVLCGAN